MGLIYKDALIKEFERLRDCDPNDNDYMGYASHFLNSGLKPSTEWDCVDNALENAPTVDAVPVVRCKDCKDWNKGFPIGGSDLCLCKAHGGFFEPDDFCSYGERREDDGN